MADELLQRIDLTALYPPLVAKIRQLVANCRARGMDYWAVSGERSWAEQDELYAQGRTKPGKIVTNAKGGQSAHNFAVAVDFCADKDVTRAGLQPDWDVAKYGILAEEAEKLGLEAGLRWKFMDAPHIQLPLGKHGITLKILQDYYHQGGKKAVFAYLDKFQW